MQGKEPIIRVFESKGTGTKETTYSISHNGPDKGKGYLPIDTKNYGNSLKSIIDSGQVTFIK
jgi:hypothetical protein